MACAKFQENQFTIDREIAENHAILVNLTASIISDIRQRCRAELETWSTYVRYNNDLQLQSGYLSLRRLYTSSLFKPICNWCDKSSP